MTRVERRDDTGSRRIWLETYRQLSARPSDELSGDDLDALGSAAWWLCRTDEALDAKQRAYAAHLRAGEERKAAMVAWWLFYGHLYWGQRSVAFGWLRRTRRHLEQLDEGREHGYWAFAEGEVALHRLDLDEAEREAQRALDLGQRLREPDLVAMGLQVQGRVLVARGQVDEGIGLLDEAMTLVTAGQVEDLLVGSVCCAVMHTCHDLADLRRAVEWAEVARDWYRGLPVHTPYHGLCRVYRGEVLSLAGRWEEAQSELRKASADLIELRPRAAAEAYYFLGEIARRRGEPETARVSYDRAQELGRDPQPGRALLAIADGDPNRALASLTTSLAQAQRDPVQRIRLLASAVEAAVAVGDLEEARKASEELRTLAERLRSRAMEAVSLGVEGVLSLAEGEAARALDVTSRARSIWSELELPYEEAQARVLAGRAATALGDAETGRLELEAARRIFRRLGATSDAEQTDSIIQGDRALPRGLTGREVEVLRLVATGHSNREVAGELFISEHTVARHLQNIFSKLGVSSRAAATSFAHDHGLI